MEKLRPKSTCYEMSQVWELWEFEVKRSECVLNDKCVLQDEKGSVHIQTSEIITVFHKGWGSISETNKQISHDWLNERLLF